METRSIKGTNVCVVGGAGFLGSHLVRYLVKYGCDVLVIDNLVTGKKEFLPTTAKFEHYDITGSETHLRKLFMVHQVQYVFNYAAEPYIPVSFERPIHVCNTNFFGALKVINAAQEAGCEGILQVSSAEIYGSNQSGRINEDGQVSPHSSYGASKAAIDSIVQVRWKEAKTPCIAMRQFNCIGERETHPYVVPEIISQIDRCKSPTCPVHLGNDSMRDFQYAGDAVKMAVDLLEHGQFGEVYNMRSEEAIGIYDLALMIGHCMDRQIEVIHDPTRDRPWEIWHLQSDNTKLYNAIQSRPNVSMESALAKTIRYYMDCGRKWPWE